MGELTQREKWIDEAVRGALKDIKPRFAKPLSDFYILVTPTNSITRLGVAAYFRRIAEGRHWH